MLLLIELPRCRIFILRCLPPSVSVLSLDFTSLGSLPKFFIRVLLVESTCLVQVLFDMLSIFLFSTFPHHLPLLWLSVVLNSRFYAFRFRHPIL